MNEILQTNVFFVITSIAVVLFTLLVCVLLFHLIKITKSIRRIVDRVEAGSEVLADDLENIRTSLNATKLVKLVMSFVPGSKPKRRSAKK